jgi:uncharacterized RmlC-like cupin family protein
MDTTTTETDSGGGFKRIDGPDAVIQVVHANEGRAEQYRVILPRNDRAGWRMARVEAAASRRELIHPETCGSVGIHLSVVTLEPGIRDGAHWHAMGEKVMYVTEGHGVIACGRDLSTEYLLGPGDAVYVPPFAVHAPRNDSDEPFTFVMVANAPMDVSVPG